MTKKRYDDIVNEVLRKLDAPDPKASQRSAQAALNMAFASGDGPLRRKYLVKAQRYIAEMDPRADADEIQQLQGRVLELQGRGGDTRIAHVTARDEVTRQELRVLGGKIDGLAVRVDMLAGVLQATNDRSVSTLGDVRELQAQQRAIERRLDEKPPR